MNNLLKLILGIFILFCCPQICSAELEQYNINKENFYSEKIAILQAINKITTKISFLEINVHSSIKFGNLIISVHSCWATKEATQPENKMLITIHEQENEIEKEIFHGWMLSTSPSLNSLEHPVYDIIPIACK